MMEQVAFNPFHLENGTPQPFDANAFRNEVKTDRACQVCCPQKAGDFLVALLLVRKLAKKTAHCVSAIITSNLVDAGKIARKRARQAKLACLNLSRFEFRIVEG